MSALTSVIGDGSISGSPALPNRAVSVLHGTGDSGGTFTETRYPGTLTNDSSVGTTAWSNPGNAGADDGSSATCLALVDSQYLQGTNFGFSIPGGATINGIELELERRSQSSLLTVADMSIVLRKSDGTYAAENKATPGNWPTTFAIASYGSSSDLWGETWTASDINDIDFGAAVQHQQTQEAGGGGLIDFMRVSVTYTI